MKKLVLETTAPFQGLPELVAYEEGLFEREGIKIEWADRDEAGIKTADTTLTEPYITLAEKKGCRVICSAFYHGTEVASDRVDADTYRAFNNAVREAVRRINANKQAYLHYFIDYHKAKDPEIGTLKPEDLREGRVVVVDPAPIPADELQRTYDWVKSWGMLDETESPMQLVNMSVQTRAHAAAQ